MCLIFVLPVASPGGHDLVAHPSFLRLGGLCLPLFGLAFLFVILLGLFVSLTFLFLLPFLFSSLSFSLFSMHLGCWLAYALPVVSSV